MEQSTIWVALIPAYEPEAALYDLLQQLDTAGFRTVVIDDGSGAAYADVFREAFRSAVVLHHESNRGKGRALKTGFAYLQTHYTADTIIVTLDADGQHRVEDAVHVCQEAERHPDSLVLGSRGFDRDVPLRSRFGNTMTRGAFQMTTGVRVRDTQTGLRAFSIKLLPVLSDISGDRYEYEMNVLLACAKRGIPIREVQTATIYLNANQSSHFQTVRDSCRIYGDLVKFASSSLFCFVVDYALYGLLSTLTAGLGTAMSIPLSNVTARVVSATVNFSINRKLVFHSRTGFAQSAAQYFALVACILCGNTLLLSYLVETLGWNRYAAKLVTEITFFTLSWLAQKFWVFPKNDKKGKTFENT